MKRWKIEAQATWPKNTHDCSRHGDQEQPDGNDYFPFRPLTSRKDCRRRKKPSDVVIGTKRGKGWLTLSQLPKQPEPKHLPRLKQEDWRGLTPLFYQHVNPDGRFTLDMTERIPLSQTTKEIIHAEY